MLSISIVLMFVAVVGAVLYVALVIAIPVWRMLDWLSPDGRHEREPAGRPKSLGR